MLDLIEQRCLASDHRDPFALAREILAGEGISLHGPEQRFLVPAVLLATHANAIHRPGDKARLLSLARRRVAGVAPTSVLPEAAELALSAGLYVDVCVGDVRPAEQARGLAHSAVARAIDALDALGGSGCRSRSAWVVLLAAVSFARRYLGVRLETARATCDFSTLETDCTGVRCPAHPLGAARAAAPAVRPR